MLLLWHAWMVALQSGMAHARPNLRYTSAQRFSTGPGRGRIPRVPMSTIPGQLAKGKAVNQAEHLFRSRPL